MVLVGGWALSSGSGVENADGHAHQWWSGSGTYSLGSLSGTQSAWRVIDVAAAGPAGKKARRLTDPGRAATPPPALTLRTPGRHCSACLPCTPW